MAGGAIKVLAVEDLTVDQGASPTTSASYGKATSLPPFGLNTMCDAIMDETVATGSTGAAHKFGCDRVYSADTIDQGDLIFLDPVTNDITNTPQPMPYFLGFAFSDSDANGEFTLNKVSVDYARFLTEFFVTDPVFGARNGWVGPNDFSAVGMSRVGLGPITENFNTQNFGSIKAPLPPMNNTVAVNWESSLGVEYHTVAAAGSDAGVTSTNKGDVMDSMSWRFNVRIKSSGANMGNQRIWVAMTDVSLMATQPANAASGILFVGFAYDSAVGNNWLAVTGDGANMSYLDTGIAATAGNTYAMSIGFNTWYGVVDKARFSILDVDAETVYCVEKATNLPSTAGTPLGAEVQVRALNNNAKSLTIACYSVAKV